MRPTDLLRSPLSVLALLTLALPAEAQVGGSAATVTTDLDVSPVQRIVDLERDDPRVMDHLEYLTGHIGPRLTGSPNLVRACEWAAAQFESFGLEARVEQWGTFPVGFDRGPASGRMLEPVEYELSFTTNAWTPGTPGPVRGAAVMMPGTADEVRALGDELAGKWIVDPPSGRDRSRRAAMREVVEALGEVGVAGRISNANSGELLYAFGNYRVEWDDLPSVVSVNLIQDQFEDLVARLEDEQQVVLEFDVDNRFLPGPFPAYNVIATLRGSELPDEYVVVGGHIDSWDPAQGAQDNGTGVATTIEAARLLAASGAQPRRSIRFMLWSGEEQGLMGSRAYVESYPEEMERISAVFVHDGGTNYLSGISGPAPLIGQLETALAPLVELDSTKPFTIRENSGLSPGGSSDHSSFVQKGVPGFFWNQTGRTSYRFSWHTQYDTIDYVVPEYQQHSSIVIAVAALGVANLPEMLSRENLIDEDAGPRGNRRRMGVFLDGNEVTGVSDGGKAAAAGWQIGDVILAIDGVAVDSMRSVITELQKGGPKKTFQLKRGEETVESVLDYTDQ